MNLDNNRENIKQGFIELLANFNTKFHLTITFPVFTSDKTCRLLLNKLINHLNRRIYGKRYVRGENYIQGFVIEEESYGMSSKHYHLVIGDDSGYLPDFERMNRLIQTQLRFLGNSSALVDREVKEEESGARSIKVKLVDTEVKRKRRNLKLKRLQRDDSTGDDEPETKWRYIDCYQLQEYYNNGDNKLEDYLTKNFNKFSYSLQDAIDSIGLLGTDEVLFPEKKRTYN